MIEKDDYVIACVDSRTNDDPYPLIVLCSWVIWAACSPRGPWRRTPNPIGALEDWISLKPERMVVE